MESKSKSKSPLIYLFRYLGSYKVYAVICPLLMIAELAGDILSPFLMSKMVDVGIANGDIEYIKHIGLLMLGLTILSLMSGVASAFVGAYAGQGFAANLRGELFDKIMRFSAADIDGFSQGSLITRVTNDTKTLGQVLQIALRLNVRAPLMMLFALIMAFRINAELAKIFVVVLPLMLILILFIISKARPLFLMMQERLDGINSFMKENIGGIRTIKAFTREEYSKQGFDRHTDALAEVSLKAVKLMVFMIPLVNLGIYTTVVALLYFGGPMLVSGMIGKGQLISFITYNTQILIGLMLLTMSMMQILRAMASAKRIYDVVTVEPSIVSKPEAIRTISRSDIVFEDVSFKYPDSSEFALKNISLSIPAKSKIGIIGPTGSAKSTLVSLISRMHDPTEGVIYYGGTDISDIDLKSLRDDISYVMQKNILFRGTLRENMKWADANASDEDIFKALEAACALDFVLEQGGLDMEVAQGGLNFSGGQRQRLAIARALVKDSQVVVFDDSMSALDANTDAKLRENLRDGYSERTLITVAQRVRSVADSDMIIVLNNGQIDGTGTHDELMRKNDLYRDIYDSQEGGLTDYE